MISEIERVMKIIAEARFETNGHKRDGALVQCVQSLMLVVSELRNACGRDKEE